MIILTVTILFAAVSAIEFKQDFNALSEDAACAVNATTVGVCKQLQECPSAMEGLRKNQRPRQCGFNGTIPVVCCEGRPTPVNAISIEQCFLYKNNVCQKTQTLAKTNSLSFSRKTTKLATLSLHGSTQNLKKVVHGGEPSKPKEFPFMRSMVTNEDDIPQK